MENKNFLNLFKPARIVYQNQPEASKAEKAVDIRMEIKEGAEKAVDKMKELAKKGEINDWDVRKAYENATTELETQKKSLSDKLKTPEDKKAFEDEFNVIARGKIENLKDKYLKVVKAYQDLRGGKSYEAVKDVVNQLGATEELKPIIEYLNNLAESKKNFETIIKKKFGEYEGNDESGDAVKAWVGLQAALLANKINVNNIDAQINDAYIKGLYSTGKDILTSAALSEIKYKEGDVSSKDIGTACKDAGLNIDTDLKDVNSCKITEFYLGTLLRTAEVKFKNDDKTLTEYKKYISDQYDAQKANLKMFVSYVGYSDKFIAGLMTNFKGPDDWKKEQGDETDLAKTLSKLEKNALDLTKLEGDDKYIYANRGDAELYRSTPEKTTLEKAVVKDGKLVWEKVDNEELLAAYNIKKIEEDKKEPGKPAEKTGEGATKEPSEVETKVPEKEGDTKPEGKTPTGKKAEKLTPSLTLKEKEEIRKEVAKLEDKDLKNNKYYEFKDGVITFKNNDAQRAIRLADIAKLFPNAKSADYVLKVERKGKSVDAKWNGKDFVDANGKHVSILSGYKISEVKSEKKAEGEIKKEPEASKEPEKATKEEQQKTEFEINKENIDKARIAARGPVRDALKREIGEELNKIANLITGKSGTVGPEFGPALKHINKLESSSIVRALSTDSANKSDLLNGILDGLKDQPKIKEYAQVAGITEEGLMDAANDLLKQNVALNIGGIAVQWNGKLNREGTLQWLDQHFAKMSDADKEKYKRFLSEKLGK